LAASGNPWKGIAVKNLARSYSTSAKYYDGAYAVKTDLVDLPFYVDLARRFGGPVLEIGCGTGRVLLPIARQGIEIHGVDNSLPMLSVLKTHLKQEPQDVRGNVQLHRGDMRQFRLKKKYPLVIMPFRPLQHMRTVDDQTRALASAAFHLKKDGIFAFDVFFPKFEKIPGGIGEETLELEWRDSTDASTVIRRYFRKDSVDKINQVFTATFFFRTYQGDRLVKEETEPLTMSYYTYPQLRALFVLAGLEPYQEYGSFARTPLDNSAEQMVFLLKRRNAVRS
jgi:SAM-dependent methyltransferase